MPAFMRMNLSHAIRMERTQGAGTGRLRFLGRNRRYFVQGEWPLSPMTDRSFFTIGWTVTGRSRRLNVRATPHMSGGLWPVD